ncbi:MAG: aminopeptidase P N-terminal domain-containing protein [Bacteroidota bacterium]
MRYTPIRPEFYINNRKRLLSKLNPNSLVIINSNDEMPRNGDQTFPFRQNSDMQYMTGLDQEKCILCLCPNHPIESMREIVFTVQTSESMVTWYGHKYTHDEVRKLSGVKTVKWLDDFESTLKDLMVKSDSVYLNMNEDFRFSTDVPSRDLRFAQKLRNEFPLHKYERLAPLITEMRMCKAPEEIDMMEKACEITESAFRRLLDFVKPGLWEYEVEASITHEFIRKGASGHAYYPIVASGAGACVLHYIENDKKLKDGDLMLLDFGAEYGNYAADLSRTIPVNGKFTKRQKDCYNAVLRTFKKAKKLIVAGTTIDEINREVCRLMEAEMIGLGLFTAAQVKKQDPGAPLYFSYYMHGNSHFMGMDVHDVGTKQMKLKPGMVLSCEPGLYIKEEGIGIRIESDILVTSKGPVDLMPNLPAEVEEIEQLMKRKK